MGPVLTTVEISEIPWHVPLTYTSEESTRIFQNALVFVFHRPEMGVEKATAEIYSLITMGMMRFWGGRSQITSRNCKKRDESGYRSRQQALSGDENDLTYKDLYSGL